MPAVRSFSKIVTDETLLESVRHGSALFPFQYYLENIWDFDFHCVDWHWHPELEYVYVQSGQAVCFAGEKKMIVSSGKGLLINSRMIHRFEAKSSTVIPNVVYSPFLLAPEESLIYQKYLHPFIEYGPDCILFDPAVPWQDTCIRYMQRVFNIQENGDAEEIEVLTALLDFWSELHQHWQPDDRRKDHSPGRTNQVRLQIMMQYIHAHYHENICLEDIASSVHISKSTALQIFHQNIGLSPVAYLIRYRLKRAAELLSSTEKKIVGIAEETGFESATYFCRRFRELYRTTPKEYRKLKTQSKSVNIVYLRHSPESL